MDSLLAVGLGVVSFAFYLYGAYPSVSVGDSGEFITAAWTLGVAHAPGFPVYSLLGHLFLLLEPWGNPAYRLNLFSACSASLSVGLLYGLLRSIPVRRSIAIGGALILACSPALMANARASEVFALNGLFVVGIFWSVIASRWPLAFFLVGLGTANHQIVLFLMPVLGLIFLMDKDAFQKEKINAAVFFVLGSSIYLALLFRAMKVPFLNVGHPDSLDHLWRVMSRADYGSLTLALGDMPARTIENTGLQLWRFLSGLCAQVTPIVALLALGVCFLARAWPGKRLIGLGLLSCLMLGPFFFVLGNLPFDAQSTGLLQRFLIAPALAAIFLAALSVETLGKKIGGSASLLLLSVLGWQSAHADWQGFRHDFTAYDYGRNNLRTLPLQAHFIMDGGDDTFYTLAYLTQVEHRRPDVILHDRGGVVFANPYGPDFRQLDRQAKEERRQMTEHLLAQNPQPLYYSTMNDQVLKGETLQQRGLLYSAKNMSIKIVYPYWKFYSFRGVAPWDFSTDAVFSDYRTRALLPFYAYQRAINLAQEGQIPLAWNFLTSAQMTGPDVLWLIPNIIHTAHLWAYAAFMHHQEDFSCTLYRWILKLSPEDQTAQKNLQFIETHKSSSKMASAKQGASQ